MDTSSVVTAAPIAAAAAPAVATAVATAVAAVAATTVAAASAVFKILLILFTFFTLLWLVRRISLAQCPEVHRFDGDDARRIL
jgi:hypothetical protein